MTGLEFSIEIDVVVLFRLAGLDVPKMAPL